MIRQANSSDTDKIVSLEEEVFKSSLGKELLENFIKVSNFDFGPNVLVLEENNEIAGYISLNSDGDVVEILNYLIKPSFQGLGYGKTFLNSVIDLYRKKASSFYLEVRISNTRAINLYKKLGFSKINERPNYYSNNEDALVFELKL